MGNKLGKKSVIAIVAVILILAVIGAAAFMMSKSAKSLYDSKGFTVTPDEFVTTYNSQMSEPDADRKYSFTIGTDYSNMNNVAFINNGEPQAAHIAFFGNTKMDEQMKQLSLVVNVEDLLNNEHDAQYFCYLVGSIMYVVDGDVKTVKQGAQFTFDMLYEVVLKRSYNDCYFVYDNLPIEKSNNGLNYSIAVYNNVAYFTVSNEKFEKLSLPSIQAIGEADFVCGGSDPIKASNGNQLAYINNSSKGFTFYFFDPNEDTNENGLIKTARGVSLKDSKGRIRNLYGEPSESGKFDSGHSVYSHVLNGYAEGKEYADYLLATIVEYDRYIYGDYSIYFLYDKDNLFRAIAFTKGF
ncbi:MAG: hypothetical protein HUJ98_07175 [Bacteroidaceae bacterium]|nr:hypothetical protein [Bacteroidaceae bacterium]